MGGHLWAFRESWDRFPRRVLSFIVDSCSPEPELAMKQLVKPLAAAMAASVSVAYAQSPALEFPAPPGVAGFGKHAVSLGDVDGDGVLDIAAADRTGTVYVLSGATGAVLRTDNTWGGALVADLEAIDVTADGTAELIVAFATPGWSYGFHVLDAGTGSLL